MKKNTTKNRLKYWHIGIIFYVLFFFFGIGIMIGVTNTKAAPSSYLAPLDTPVATPEPTTPPTPVPTTPPTPVPTTPPTPVPTTPPAPKPTVPPAQPTAPSTQPTTAAATPTATGTVTATSTATGILPTSLAIPPGHNTTHTPPSNPGPGGNLGAPDAFGLSLAISTSGIFLFGGGLFLLYLRRNSQGAPALRTGNLSLDQTNSLWANGGTSMGATPASVAFAAATPSAALSPQATGSMFSANNDMVSDANTVQQPIWPSSEEGRGPVYRPGALRPITPPIFSQQAHNQQASDPKPDAPASDMSPFSFDAFDLPQGITPSMSPELWSNQSVPENLAPRRETNPLAFDVFDLPQDVIPSISSDLWAKQSVPEDSAPTREVNLPSFDAFDLPQDVIPSIASDLWANQSVPEDSAPTREVNLPSFAAFDLPQDINPPIVSDLWPDEFMPADSAPTREINLPLFNAFDLPQDINPPIASDLWSDQSVPENPAPTREVNQPSFDVFDLPQDIVPSMSPELWSSQSAPEDPVPAREMNPPSFDVFDLSQDIVPSMLAERWSGQAQPEDPAPVIDSTVAPEPSITPSVSAANLSVQLPDVAEDYTLLEIMRQAQSGLFVLSDPGMDPQT